MKKPLSVVLLFFFLTSFSQAGIFDTLQKTIRSSREKDLDQSTVISGLKEALSIGTKHAVTAAGQVDGYFENELIKILLPEQMQSVADTLSKLGFQKPVDNFILSMNRAAEKAAPEAKPIFLDAIKEMTFEDAMSIVQGSDTAATDYFRRETSDKIYDAFKPIIESSMNEVGVTRAYQNLVDKYTSIPFMEKNMQLLELDHYVTEHAMEGLFTLVGKEEQKIRTDPAARVTDLLKKVFGR